MNPLQGIHDAADKVYRYGFRPVIANAMGAFVKGDRYVRVPASVYVTPEKMRALSKMDLDSAIVSARNEATRGISEGIVAKNGKIFFREPDNSLVRDKSKIAYFDEWISNPENAEFNAKQKIADLHDNILGIKLFDAKGAPRHVEFVPDVTVDSVHTIQSEILSAYAASKTYNVRKMPGVVINREQPTSWFSKPGSNYDPEKNVITFDRMVPGDAFHEFSHASDMSTPFLGTAIAANQYLGAAIPLAYGAAYIGGEDIKSAIPGSIDNSVINAVKAYGPEMMLASGLANLAGSEYRAFKNTKKRLQKEFDGDQIEFSSRNFAPESSLDDMLKHHKLALSSYLVKPLTLYTGLRGGTYLYEKMNKEGSIFAPAAEAYASIKRGLESIPHFPTIFKSMLLSSPSAPRNSAVIGALGLGIPIGGLYAIDYSFDPKKYFSESAMDVLQENML